MSKIQKRKFKRTVHINNQEWTYRIVRSHSKEITYIKCLDPVGKQYSLEVKNLKYYTDWCCDLKCEVRGTPCTTPLTPAVVKDLIIKEIGIKIYE